MGIIDIEEISTPAGAYGKQLDFVLHGTFRYVSRKGSYAGAGYLISTLNTTGKVSNYARWLDLDEAITHTIWSQAILTFQRFLPIFFYH